MEKFENLCEQFGVLKKTIRERYPREITFTNEFVEALKKEYYKHKIEESGDHPVKNRPFKFLKALKFHIEDLEANAEKELEVIKQRYAEESVKNIDVPTKHQIKIAKDTLKMSDAGARIMGGMTKEEARRILTKHRIKIKEQCIEDSNKSLADLPKSPFPSYTIDSNTDISRLPDRAKYKLAIDAIRRGDKAPTLPGQMTVAKAREFLNFGKPRYLRNLGENCKHKRINLRKSSKDAVKERVPEVTVNGVKLELPSNKTQKCSCEEKEGKKVLKRNMTKEI